MKICVYGLWHLGCVTAACLSGLGFDVIGLDNDEKVVDKLNKGVPPLFEPGLDDLIKSGFKSNKLKFTNNPENALKDVDYLWIAFDTPVDENDVADIDFLEESINSIMKYFKNDLKIIISSQAPVGFTKKIEENYSSKYDKKIHFAISPENLRLGKAINVFMEPDRIIIGIRDNNDMNKYKPLFSKITNRLEWMSIESAEMTKHAINSFLAMSVTYANELAAICESVGANMREVERGLKTEMRIGPKAYLRAGAAFSGGTLARDVQFLKSLGHRYNKELFLFEAIKKSNDYHKEWVKRKCLEVLHDIKNKKIGILGLTYKPDTDTLRRSYAIEICRWLVDHESKVFAYDPYVKELPSDLNENIKLVKNLDELFDLSECIVVSTEHKLFKEVDKFNNIKKDKIVIDPNGFLEDTFSKNDKYYVVGR